MKTLFLPLLALALASCNTLPTEEDTADVRSSVVKYNASAADLAALKMPVLRSPWCDKQWGEPTDIRIHADGSYGITYNDPKVSLNYLSVSGFPTAKENPATPPTWQVSPMPGIPSVKNSQEWRTTTILGQTVKWYQNDGGSGADWPGYRTVYFSATSPDGRTGWYQVEVTAKSEAEAAERINKVGW